MVTIQIRMASKELPAHKMQLIDVAGISQRLSTQTRQDLLIKDSQTLNHSIEMCYLETSAPFFPGKAIE